MTTRNTTSKSPPAKRAPGLLAKAIGGFMQIIGWILFSLILAILVEWIGMATIWQEQGSNHAKNSLASDLSYLNKRLLFRMSRIENKIQSVVDLAMAWVDRQSEKLDLSNLHSVDKEIKIKNVVERLNTKAETGNYQPYIEAVPNVIKTFFVRVALLIFSLAAFALFFILGMVDGLVERDLRRWGGGRESSMVYNLARKSIFRFFIGACVIYISFPISINPTWIILPFAVAIGFSTRVTFERLKKYF